mmetsp:Transcript_17378/g.51287  ORF Transcript_17378/g.51287 Transcript_17378/m.51287 type:complete len:367 (+) Transcript_17378:87-1187(+)
MQYHALEARSRAKTATTVRCVRQVSLAKPSPRGPAFAQSGRRGRALGEHHGVGARGEAGLGRGPLEGLLRSAEHLLGRRDPREDPLQRILRRLLRLAVHLLEHPVLGRARAEPERAHLARDFLRPLGRRLGARDPPLLVHQAEHALPERRALLDQRVDVSGAEDGHEEGHERARDAHDVLAALDGAVAHEGEEEEEEQPRLEAPRRRQVLAREREGEGGVHEVEGGARGHRDHDLPRRDDVAPLELDRRAAHRLRRLERRDRARAHEQRQEEHRRHEAHDVDEEEQRARDEERKRARLAPPTPPVHAGTVRGCVGARVRARVRACARVRGWVRARARARKACVCACTPGSARAARAPPGSRASPSP